MLRQLSNPGRRKGEKASQAQAAWTSALPSCPFSSYNQGRAGKFRLKSRGTLNTQNYITDSIIPQFYSIKHSMGNSEKGKGNKNSTETSSAPKWQGHVLESSPSDFRVSGYMRNQPTPGNTFHPYRKRGGGRDRQDKQPPKSNSSFLALHTLGFTVPILLPAEEWKTLAVQELGFRSVFLEEISAFICICLYLPTNADLILSLCV